MSDALAGPFDTLIRGGTVVTVDGSAEADIAVVDGRIAAVAQSLDGAAAETEIDATGLLVLPGAIDVHTHFETLVADKCTADSFESGSRAAAAGGITTFVNFAVQIEGRPLAEAVAIDVEKAEAASHVDFGLHVHLTRPDADAIAEVESLIADGFTSFKLFTAVEGLAVADAEILALQQTVGDAGGLVMVHSEDGPLIDHLTAQLLAQGKTGIEFLNQARPPASEALAVSKVTEYGRFTGCPVYIVHLSSREGLDAVRRARSAGAEVYVETRAAYLFMDSSVYERPDAAKWMAWPPIRDLDQQDALWCGMQAGEIQTYATDHMTWMLADKMAPGLTFATVPGGMSNVQTSLAMLYSEGVRTGRISLPQLVGLTSTNPAKIFGMWPQKGSLSVGADADAVLIDPDRKVTIVEAAMQSASDFDPYNGRTVHGWPVLTMSRGDVVVADGTILSAPGRGRLVRRARIRDALHRPVRA